MGIMEKKELTDEEIVKALENGNCNAHAIYGIAYEQARKETAEKFAERVKEETDHGISALYDSTVDEICKEITGEHNEKV